MTRHDEVRQILHENEFRFKDGRTALEMTDEEVEKFLVEFASRMTEFVRQFQISIQRLSVAFIRASESLQDLGQSLDSPESNE